MGASVDNGPCSFTHGPVFEDLVSEPGGSSSSDVTWKADLPFPVQ